MARPRKLSRVGAWGVVHRGGLAEQHLVGTGMPCGPTRSATDSHRGVGAQDSRIWLQLNRPLWLLCGQ